MMCSRSLYLAVACFLCCIGSSIGFAPVKTVAGARSTNIQQLESSYRSNQQLLPKHLPGPRQPTLIYNGNPSKSLTSKVNKNKHKIAALAIVLAGIGFTAYPSPCFAASSILSGLTDGERIVVIIAHYLAFPACTLAMYALYKKMDIIQQRIYSPFTLMVGLVCIQLGLAFEMGNHHYTTDWGLKIAKTDLINGSFGFFTFGGNKINAIALKKKGVPLLRCPDFSKGIINGLVDLVAIIGDLFLLIATIIQPLLYVMLGRAGSNSVSILSSTVAGVFTLIRLWQHLGPNTYTFWGGTLFFVLVLSGVGFNVLYSMICVEFLHVAIGGSFVGAMIPFTIALWNAELPGPTDVDSGEVIKGVVG